MWIDHNLQSNTKNDWKNNLEGKSKWIFERKWSRFYCALCAIYLHQGDSGAILAADAGSASVRASGSALMEVWLRLADQLFVITDWEDSPCSFMGRCSPSIQPGLCCTACLWRTQACVLWCLSEGLVHMTAGLLWEYHGSLVAMVLWCHNQALSSVSAGVSLCAETWIRAGWFKDSVQCVVHGGRHLTASCLSAV